MGVKCFWTFSTLSGLFFLKWTLNIFIYLGLGFIYLLFHFLLLMISIWFLFLSLRLSLSLYLSFSFFFFSATQRDPSSCSVGLSQSCDRALCLSRPNSLEVVFSAVRQTVIRRLHGRGPSCRPGLLGPGRWMLKTLISRAWNATLSRFYSLRLPWKSKIMVCSLKRCIGKGTC